MPVASKSYLFMFSLHRQASAGEPVPLSAVDKVVAMQNFGPVTRGHEAVLSDQPWYGTGTNFGSFREPEFLNNTVPARVYPVTELTMLYGLGFVCGEVASVEIDPGPSGFWWHTITWQDINTDPEARYATAVERLGEFRKLVGYWMSQAELSIQLGQFPTFSISGMARQYEVEAAASAPADLTSAAFFKAAKTTLEMGTVGGAYVDISGKFTNIQLSWANGANPKLRAGAPVGQDRLPQRADIGDQILSGQIAFEFETERRADFTSELEKKIRITLFAAVNHGGGLPVKAVIEIPRCKFASESFSEEGRTTIWTATLDNTSVLQPLTADPPMSVVIDSDIPDTQILVPLQAAFVEAVDDTGADGPEYITGEDVEVTVSFDRAVDVVTTLGTPKITANIGANPRELLYVSGTGTTDLVFSYPVVGGDNAELTEFVIPAQSIDLDGGEINDALYGDPVNLAFAAGVVADVADRTVNPV